MLTCLDHKKSEQPATPTTSLQNKLLPEKLLTIWILIWFPTFLHSSCLPALENLQVIAAKVYEKLELLFKGKTYKPGNATLFVDICFELNLSVFSIFDHFH